MNDRIDHLRELHRRSSTPASPCPESDRLAALAAGEAWPWRRRRLTRHLAECPHCAHEYRTVLAARDGLRQALGVTKPAAPNGWPGALIPAGAVAGLVAILIVSLSPGPESGTGPAMAPPASDTLFASNFDNGHATPSESDTLFRSDFSGSSES